MTLYLRSFPALAAAALAAAAKADPDPLPLRLITASAIYTLDGRPLPQEGLSARSAVDLYRNDAGPFTRMSNDGPRARWGADDLSFVATPADGGNVLITQIAPMFSASTADGSSPFAMVMIVEIFGTIDEFLEPGDWRDPDHSFLGGFAVEFTGVLPGFAYQVDPPIDLTSLVDGGIRINASDITIPANGFAYTQYFFTDSNFLLLSQRATLSFSSNTEAGPGGTNGPQIGRSEDFFWFDSDNNGILTATDRFNLGGGVHLANFGTRILGYFIPECGSDFNADGFTDGFDYDDFVSCFEGASCLPGRTADFNGDGFVDGFDYDDFVAAFELGCR